MSPITCIAEDVAARYGIDPAILYSRVGRVEHGEARQFFHTAIRLGLGLSLERTGRRVKRDHTSVANSVRRARERGIADEAQRLGEAYRVTERGVEAFTCSDCGEVKTRPNASRRKRCAPCAAFRKASRDWADKKPHRRPEDYAAHLEAVAAARDRTARSAWQGVDRQPYTRPTRPVEPSEKAKRFLAMYPKAQVVGRVA